MEQKNSINVFKIILLILITWFCISFYNFSRNGKFKPLESGAVFNTRTGQIYAIDPKSGKLLTLEEYKNRN